jgi:hypothetical protein
MADTHVPEDTKLAKAAGLFFVVGIVALIGGAALGGIMNRGSPEGTPYPGIVYPVMVIGVASLIAGVVAFLVYVRKESGQLREEKKQHKPS